MPTLPAAVIFDFDGLIIDTEFPAYQAWCEIYAEYGATLELTRWVACVGSSEAAFDPVAHLSELTGKAFDRTQLFVDKDRRKRLACDDAPVLPGVRERIAEARNLGWKVALASSSDAIWINRHLDRIGLRSSFDAIRTKDNVARIKPFPDLYLSASAAIQVEPSRCVVFEDSRNGVLAAKAAGMRCFAVPNKVTQALDFSEADGVLKSLASVSLAALRF